MKSIKCSRIVVVADSDYGRDLAARLRRMEVALVSVVTGIDEARQLCLGGGVDACLVTTGLAVPDGVSLAESDAPGRSCGVPALIVAPVVTLHMRRTARRCGYLAAVSATLPPRLLYRRIGAALQRQRGERRRRRPAGGIPLVGLANPAVFDKPTLH
jgi:threonine dehydrogenase-like Zn-dependent dehydrogenase